MSKGRTSKKQAKNSKNELPFSFMSEVFCKNRATWREWLENNHKSSSEVWLVKYKKHTKKKTINYDESVEEAICFGWIDTIVKKIDDEKYKQKFTPRRKKGSTWSKLNCQRARMLIREKKMTENGLEEFEKWTESHPEDEDSSEEEDEEDEDENLTGGKRKAEIHDLSEGKKKKKRKFKHDPLAVPEIPDDVLESLEDAKLKDSFLSLTYPQQKLFLKYINSCKRADTRVRRIEKVLGCVKAGKKPKDLFV